MFSLLLLCLLSSLTFITQIQADDEKKVAIAYLNTGNIVGAVEFTEIDAGIHLSGIIAGMPAGHYGFHVHELGDISTCAATGAHFNPDENTHGGPTSDVRHVGDLGNAHFVTNAGITVATINFVDPVLALHGRNNILGRALVLHENEDDLGEGGHELSNSTGNAGGRVACAVIGLKYPSDPWNSATSMIPSIAFITSVQLFIVYVLRQ